MGSPLSIERERESQRDRARERHGSVAPVGSRLDQKAPSKVSQDSISGNFTSHTASSWFSHKDSEADRTLTQIFYSKELQ